jgi:adenylosuccinate synthase
MCEGEQIDYFPFGIEPEDVKPVWRNEEGWSKDLTAIDQLHDLPAELMRYVEMIERETGRPITTISVGPDREQTLTRAIPEALAQ